jgi:ribosome-binding factor A
MTPFSGACGPGGAGLGAERKEEVMVDHPRARKLADRIKVIVAQMLDTRIKDPRLGFVTVTDVRVTGDLQNASVFYTVYGTDEEREGTAAALESAKGIIRSEVGKQTGVRLTPTLEFHLDSVPETAAHLDAALVEARRRDAELAALREGKAYAGEADPYRAPEQGDEPED